MDFAFKLRKRLCHVGFPGSSDGKEFAPNAGDLPYMCIYLYFPQFYSISSLQDI